MRLQNWATAMGRGWRWCRTMVIAPVSRRMAAVLLRWAAADAHRSGEPTAWKKGALDDFSAWLDAAPDDPPGGEPGLEGCDLYTVLTEFAALRQEIKLQSRQQRATVREHGALIERFQVIDQQLASRVDRLGEIHDSLKRDIEVKSVLPFLDVRDALLRGEAAARRIAAARGLWRRPPKGIDAVVEGYAMALRRFDRSLNLLGVSPVATVGHPFDATCMRAVDKRFDAAKTPGIILEETLGGFMRHGEILRTAEVVVNRK